MVNPIAAMESSPICRRESCGSLEVDDCSVVGGAVRTVVVEVEEAAGANP